MIIRFGQTTCQRINPLVSLISSDYSCVGEKEMNQMLQSKKILRTKYPSVGVLWYHSIAANAQNYSDYCAVLTNEYYLVCFNLKNPQVWLTHLPVAEHIQLCSLTIQYPYVILGGPKQFVLIDLRKDSYQYCDFGDPQAVLCFRIEINSSKYSINEYSINSTDIAGDYSLKILPYGVEIFAGIAMLAVEDDQPILVAEFFDYASDKITKFRKYIFELEYSAGHCVEENALVSRIDSEGQLLFVAVNSKNKYLCQLFLICSKSGRSIHQRPINFVSENDVLPSDQFGRTSMVISDAAWIQNNMLVVINFSGLYFCMISRFGDVMKVVSRLSPCPLLCNFFMYSLSKKSTF